MDEATIALVLSRARIAAGLAAVLVPGLVARVLSGSSSQGLEPMLARMLGARDIALGLGTVVAVDRGGPVRGWVEGSALADAADCGACLLARGRMTPRAFRVTAGFAGTAALIGVVLARRLDPPPPAHPGQPEALATGHHDADTGAAA